MNHFRTQSTSEPLMAGEPGESSCPTYEDICTFCLESKGGDNVFIDLGVTEGPHDHVLFESDHFIVVPCVGALTDWYVLIVPKRHTLSTGWMTSAEHQDLRVLRREVTA